MRFTLKENKTFSDNISFFEKLITYVFGFEYLSFKEVFCGEKIQFEVSQIKKIYLFRGKPKLIEVDFNHSVRQFLVTKDSDQTIHSLLLDKKINTDQNLLFIKYFFSRILLVLLSCALTILLIAGTIFFSNVILKKYIIQTEFCNSECVVVLHQYSVQCLMWITILIGSPVIMYTLEKYFSRKLKHFTNHGQSLIVFILFLIAIIRLELPINSYLKALRFYKFQNTEVLSQPNSQNSYFLDLIEELKKNKNYLQKFKR